MNSKHSPAVDAAVEHPEIVVVTRTAERTQLKLLVQETMVYFNGHFPGYPILPGVVQVHWAIQYGREFFALGSAFPSSIRIKFHKPIRPNHRLTLNLTYLRSRNIVQFEYQDDGGLCSAGQAEFLTA